MNDSVKGTERGTDSSSANLASKNCHQPWKKTLLIKNNVNNHSEKEYNIIREPKLTSLVLDTNVRISLADNGQPPVSKQTVCVLSHWSVNHSRCFLLWLLIKSAWVPESKSQSYSCWPNFSDVLCYLSTLARQLDCEWPNATTTSNLQVLAPKDYPLQASKLVARSIWATPLCYVEVICQH